MNSAETPTRVSIEVDGLQRRSPAPTASKIGNILMSGGIYGRDRVAGAVPDDVDEQIRLMFENIEAVMNAAGGTARDIIKVAFDVASMDLRPRVDEAWLAMFPDARSRPARHVVPATHLPSPAVVRCELYAVLGQSLD
jgi:enamine deaminase RidA (YjgF/YER057c/UK114 family)